MILIKKAVGGATRLPSVSTGGFLFVCLFVGGASPPRRTQPTMALDIFREEPVFTSWLPQGQRARPGKTFIHHSFLTYQ